ncbi:hypothetical protein PVAP13_3NG269500 [Panicum virgatum]|uniref:TTF-type domain-containing protein n=1 Tax=Panicum virgatum TaxID=38727 RepID=A0A8T0UE98_PANVG|nr:hypothetical protein PVAP13_3NG269500 [Panicum virgatum]
MSKRTLFNCYSSSSSTPSLENNENTRPPKLPRVEFSSSDIVSDPGLHKPIDEHPFEIRDQMKRAYALRGPTELYSESKDAAFCLYCYLFFVPGKSEKFGSDVFAKKGYEKWKKALERFDKHAASHSQNNAIMKCDDFMDQRTSVTNKSSTSLNKGTFREMVQWYKNKKNKVKDAYEKGSKYCQMLSPHIQKDLTKACAEEVTAVIMDEIRGRHFSVLIDESRDVSIKEQMAMILRFVNDEGKIVERFLGLKHIEKCTSAALKEALVNLLSSHKLSISMLREQGYDSASNMRGEFNGVQRLIRDINPYAFYVHCFAHQLQLVVVADALVAKYHDVLLEKLENGEITTGRGMNQESSLARPGDTRWSSHLKTLLRILVMWEAILEVLEVVKKDSIKPTCNGGAFGLIGKMESFDFVFIMHLMIELLSITDSLSKALQRKDQDIVEAMNMIMDVRDCLQDMRDNGWEPLLKSVKLFCDKNDIKVPNMDKEVNARGTSARRRQKVTNMYYYNVEIFLAAIDAIMSEMNHRFNEVSSELLVCMASLNRRNNFSSFDVAKLVRLAEIYAEDFNVADLLLLPGQLKDFINRARRTQSFSGCTEFSKVTEIMVKKTMHTSYLLLYRLIELTLILPVATASVERVFSAMSLIKTDLRSKMEDEWLNDLMICYIEKQIFRSIEMKKHPMLLPKQNVVVCSIVHSFPIFKTILKLLYAVSHQLFFFYVMCRLLRMKNNGY